MILVSIYFVRPDFTQLIWMDDLSKGIRAEYIDVLVTRKPHPMSSGTRA
jgi:hypothetical protein